MVLGGGVYGNGEIGDDPAKRLLKAYEIHKREAAPMVLSGGRVSEKLPIEADIMRNILIGLGVDKNKIDVDNESKDTLENAKYVAKIIGLDKKIILVTSAYHMKRSEMLFKKVGFKNLCTEAADFKFDGNYTFYDILPTTCNLNTSSKVLKEYLGIIFYYIFG
ncbi:MAG: YdcF family protein [Deferribacterales bacterium]